MPSLDASAINVINDPARMFPTGVGSASAASKFRAGPRIEYLHLLVRQIRSQKVGLTMHAYASGSTFAIGKKTAGRQREVWHGGVISERAEKPPRPPLLADPAGLIHLECSRHAPLWMSQRDAQVWFDQLRLPPHLAKYMGRPPVEVRELLSLGMDLSELQATLLDDVELDESSRVTPVNLTWAMGYSWSSFVAQSTMIQSCHSAGFPRECFVTEGHQLPSQYVTSICGTIAVNTEDVTHFLRSTRRNVTALDIPPLALLDHAREKQGIRAQPTKQ